MALTFDHRNIEGYLRYHTGRGFQPPTHKIRDLASSASAPSAVTLVATPDASGAQVLTVTQSDGSSIQAVIPPPDLTSTVVALSARVDALSSAFADHQSFLVKQAEAFMAEAVRLSGATQSLEAKVAQDTASVAAATQDLASRVTKIEAVV